jgi:hypothetical protein
LRPKGVALTTFYGWTEAELLAAMLEAQRELSKGKAIISAGSGDVNTAMQIQANAQERVFFFQKALHELDPETYAMFANVGHSQTQAQFSNS